jgi:transposase-like protein
MILVTEFIISSRNGVPKVQRLTYHKLKQLKSLFTLLINGLILMVIGVDSFFLKRIIIDLMLKGLSLNQLQEHLRLIYGLHLSHAQIRQIETEAANKAKRINLQYDTQIASKIKVIEADEIFQGKNSVTLGAVAKNSNYCLGLHWSPDRTKESIIAFLKPIAKRCINVKVVITDLFSGYKEIISDLFKKAIHLVCHLHAGRLLRKTIRHLSSVLSHKKKELDKSLKDMVKGSKNLTKCRDRIVFLTVRLKTDQETVKLLTKKKLQKSKKCTKTIDSKLDCTENRVQKDEKELKKLRANRDILKKDQRKIPAQQKEIKKKILMAQQELLQSGRLVHDFRKLLKDLTPKFEIHKQQYLTRLAQSKYSIAKEILKMIQDNPDLFSVRNSQILPSNYQNTNTVEGLFSLFRRLLDSTRLLSSEAGSDRYCDLFRLYHNTMPPFTGPHRDYAPVERLGINLHGKTYLDLLFPVRHRVTRFFYQTLKHDQTDFIHFHPVPSVQSKIISCY